MTRPRPFVGAALDKINASPVTRILRGTAHARVSPRERPFVNLLPRPSGKATRRLNRALLTDVIPFFKLMSPLVVGFVIYTAV